jgi:LacI family transcriptional regulator
MNRRKPKNNPRVTQKDVARRAGVSTSIVSYVINNGPRSVSEETRQRVLQAIEELGYRPYAQRQLVMREKWGSGEIIQFGIILCGDTLGMLRSMFYGEVLAGIYQEAFQSGKRIRFLQFWDELKDPVLFNDLIHSDEVSGLILISLHQALKGEEDEALLDRIIERIDCIVCAEDCAGRFPTVSYDLREAAHKAVTHLIQLGHRRIAFVGGPDSRVDGYRSALLDAGLDYDPALVFHPGVINTAREGYEGAKQILSLSSRPAAIFAANDEGASGIISFLCQNKIRVPEDIAIVSIDDVDLASYLTPPLTTVRLPKMELGQQVVKMLIEQARQDDPVPISVVLPNELIIRESCGYRLRSR